MEALGFDVTHGYGLTETYGPAVTCAWHPEWDAYTAAERAHYVETGSYLSEEEESELPESEQLKNDAGDNVRVDAGGPLQPSLIDAHPHTTSELMEALTGLAVDAPLCLTCGTKMRPSGSCTLSRRAVSHGRL